MTKINEIWNDLENDRSLQKGLLLRRYSATFLPDVFVGLQRPENLRCVALRIHSGSKINTSVYSNLKDIRIIIVPDDNDNSKSFLLIVLTNSEHNEVFSTLSEDLINQIAFVSQEEVLIREILNRFEKWKALFDRAASDGLSDEEQRGLFGELYFLRKWIFKSSNIQHCVQCWLGTERELRDFQSLKHGIEVKTTQGNNHQKIQISSERQLDSSKLDTLILYHLSLDSQQGNGETLNEIISSIVELLSQDFLALVQFKYKLLQAGYFFHHITKYQIKGYQIRQDSFYKVRDNFPRIEENDVRTGVGDVKYSIVLSNHSEYLMSESIVLKLIN